MAYDDVLIRIKQFGPYQCTIYVLLFIPIIFNALNKFGVVFINAKNDFRCLQPFENAENATYELYFDDKNANSDRNSKLEKWSTCYRPRVANASVLSDDKAANRSDLVRCESFIYDKSTYQSTTTSEWDLVCDQSWRRSAADAFFMLGVMIGSIVFGGMSDKYGRKPVFFFTTLLQLLSGLAVAAAPEYVSYVIARIFLGSSLTGQFLVIYVLVMEIVGPEKRLLAGLGSQAGLTVGYISSALISYYITNWRMLQIFYVLPIVAFVPYWWLIPESARWLYSNGRIDEAKNLLKQASKKNKVDVSDATIDSLLSTNAEKSIPDTRKSSVLDLMRYPNLRRKSILIFFNWFVNCLTYYGLSWNSPNLGGNQHLNYVISGAVEIPAYIFLAFTLDRWGRRAILSGSLIISSVVLMSTAFIPEGSTWLLISLSMIGKLAITSSYATIYVFTSEQFPTVIRNVGLGASSTSARIGGIMVPFINQLSEIWISLPLVIFGVLTFICAISTLSLPETLHRDLPETIQDGEMFGTKKSKRSTEMKTIGEKEKFPNLLEQNSHNHEKEGKV